MRKVAAALAAVLLTALGGCARKATDFSEYSPYTGTAPLTIRGASPGQPGSEVIALFGPPERHDAPRYGPETLQWQRFSDMVVTLDGARGRVSEVLGDRLTAGADVIVEHGMSEADVRRVLGKPLREESHYRPSGSGVISLGRTLDARALTYARDGRSIEVTLRQDRLAYVQLRLPAR